MLIERLRRLLEDSVQLKGRTKANGWILSPEGRRIRELPMNRASNGMRRFARRLMDNEALESMSVEENKASFRVCDKLRPYLSTLMGIGGFRALLSRSLSLGAAEVSWLRDIHITADGTFGGLEEVHTKVGPEEFSEGRVVVLAHLLGLMSAFIGEILTLRLIREVWPKVRLSDLEFANEDINEKAN